jgi:hypothetical protein
MKPGHAPQPANEAMPGTGDNHFFNDPPDTRPNPHVRAYLQSPRIMEDCWKFNRLFDKGMEKTPQNVILQTLETQYAKK